MAFFFSPALTQSTAPYYCVCSIKESLIHQPRHERVVKSAPILSQWLNVDFYNYTTVSFVYCDFSLLAHSRPQGATFGSAGHLSRTTSGASLNIFLPHFRGDFCYQLVIVLFEPLVKLRRFRLARTSCVCVFLLPKCNVEAQTCCFAPPVSLLYLSCVQG